VESIEYFYVECAKDIQDCSVPIDCEIFEFQEKEYPKANFVQPFSTLEIEHIQWAYKSPPYKLN